MPRKRDIQGPFLAIVRCAPVEHQLAFECDDVIRSAHVSRSREPQVPDGRRQRILHTIHQDAARLPTSLAEPFHGTESKKTPAYAQEGAGYDDQRSNSILVLRAPCSLRNLRVRKVLLTPVMRVYRERCELSHSILPFHRPKMALCDVVTNSVSFYLLIIGFSHKNLLRRKAVYHVSAFSGRVN